MTFPFLKLHSSTHIWQCTAVWTAFTSSQCICYASNDIMRCSACQSSVSTAQTTRTEPQNLHGEKGLASNTKGCPLAKPYLMLCLLYCVLSYSYLFYFPSIQKKFQIIPKLLILYPACRHVLFAEGHNFSEHNMPFSFYSMWVFNSSSTWKLGNLYFSPIKL